MEQTKAYVKRVTFLKKTCRNATSSTLIRLNRENICIVDAGMKYKNFHVTYSTIVGVEGNYVIPGCIIVYNRK